MKQIPNYPGYAVTNDGRVWSKPRKLADGRNWRGKWLKPGKDNNGYLIVGLCAQGKQYSCRVHYLVLQTFVGPCPEGMECRHLNGDPADNRLSNLQWGSKSENQKDRILHGTSNRGEQNGVSKLTVLKVCLIRQFYAMRSLCFTHRELAKLFNITGGHVGDIVNRKSWKHVK